MPTALLLSLMPTALLLSLVRHDEGARSVSSEWPEKGELTGLGEQVAVARPQLAVLVPVTLTGDAGSEPSQDRSGGELAQPLAKVHGQLDGWSDDQLAQPSPSGRPPGVGEQAQRQGIHGT